MKKVFAFLSMLLLTIACVGLSVKNAPAKAATGKFTIDPTLAEDEIPVYIMDSIMSTFPHYYDNDAKPDSNWQGAARMYPWNETRLRIAQLDDKGQPTGKYYAIYFAGHTVATEKDGQQVLGAGKNILFWDLDDNGNVVAVKYSDGKKAGSGNASDPSLSHMRTNKSGKDITVDPTTLGIGDEGTNFYNRSIVFDAQGRVVRGIGLDDVYSAAEATEGAVKFAPEYCRVKGVVTKIADGVVCDKALTEKLDENGETVRDENGDPVMVPSDKDDLIYSRFVWEFFTEQPTNVNTVPYLSTGWDAMLWDYCYAVEGGYMAIAFVGSADNTAHVVKGDQVEPYKATLVTRYMSEGMTEAEATAKAEKDAVAGRACVKELRIPAGGFTFDYGYLDRGKATNDLAFNSTVINGYLYGRTMLTKKDRNGNPVVNAETGEEVKIGLAEQRTYNFSVGDVKYDDKVINGTSYRLVNLPSTGLNVVEIMQGDKLSPTTNINFNGVMRYWNVEDDLTSFKADSSSLDLYIKESINGGNTLVAVEPSNDYTSMDAIVTDFLADVAKWKGVEVADIKMGSAADFQSNFRWGEFFATNADNAKNPDYAVGDYGHTSFWNVQEHKDKWGWLLEKIYQTMVAYPGGDTYTASLDHVATAMNSYYCGSPQTIAYAFWYFFNGQKHGYFGFNFDEGHNVDWLDPRTNVEKWNDYTIDASTKAVGDNWTVTYTVTNRETTNSSSLTVKYVVVDSYTPVITFDAGKLRYVPRKVGDSYVIDPINPYEIVKAYDGQYNGVNILGNDITQNVVFNTDLDFNNPTQGRHQVIATIKNNAGTKEASVKFTVNVVDVAAPMVAVRTVTIQQGQDFDPRDGITVAYDDVDGNLFDVDYEWWYQTTPSKAIDTNNLNGTDRKISVTVEVSDRSGNVVEAKYTLVIIATKTADKALSDLDKKVDSLQDTIDEVYDVVSEIQESLDALTEKVNAIDANINATKNAVDAVKTTVDATKTTVDATKSAVDSTKNFVETSEKEIKDAITEVMDNVDEIKSSVDTVNGKVDSVKTTVESVKSTVETKSSGCKSGAVIALGLSTAIAAMAVVLKKRH